MEWEAVDGVPYSSIVGMDPFAAWVLGPGLVHFSRGEDKTLIPFIMVLFDPDAIPFFEELVASQDAEIEILLPALYPFGSIGPGDYFVAYARKSFFEDLAKIGGRLDALRVARKQIKLSLPLKLSSLPDKWPQDVEDPPVSPVPPDTVVVGIIDDGICFAHDRFRMADGSTRVHYFWRMDGGPLEPGTTVNTGLETWKANLGGRKGIDALLQDFTTDGIVDEEKLYRVTKLVDFTLPDHKSAAWNASHGTHVLDLATGADPAHAPANRAIIAVQLPVAATADTSGAGLDVHVLEAVDYILDRADRLAGSGPKLPVVINFSYGMLAGPHDGTSLLEAAIDKSIKERGAPLSLVLPAGNGHLSRCHAELAFADKNSACTLNWRVQPDDLTPTQMEIWMPYDGGAAPSASRVTIRIESPSGLLSQALHEVDGSGIQLVDQGEVLLRATYTFVKHPTERGLFAITMLPTASLQPPDPAPAGSAVAPSGVWKVHVSNVSLQPGQLVQAWIQRDDVIYGYPRRGRQSYFEASCYWRFNPVSGKPIEWDYEENAENVKDGVQVPPCHVKRRGLINAISTGCETTVVGGVYGKEFTVVEYSAGGPVTPMRGAPAACREGPDVLAVSDDSRVHRGIIAAGSKSGSAVAIGGTSVATPQIARKAAVLWKSPTTDGSRSAIRNDAFNEELANPTRPPLPPEIRGGTGRSVADRPLRLPRFEVDA